ncbi:hypothetical protein U879_10015 [Defluviimonas sp. 20V17]|uniref:histidine kinase n=1 Tax=Allgaiera indica TaxID=765699 RepID=A0AAN4ZYX6_9RHOB|nr:ATP-binding protein [Allgaiera indica]KDB03885.1 hypothetical protein U879_10015 [Defluviimonas sp. 20V17]GHE00076.1 hypothetical protein GCM10008024_10340 [Allgaiera indica]SDW37624.1 PAS domain S-box-containing protein [Allgaiera indica]
MSQGSESYLVSLLGPATAGAVVSLAILLMIGLLARSALGHRRQLRKIREQEDDLALQRKAVDMHAMVKITGVDGRILYANDNLIQTIGYSVEELRGRYASDVFLDEDPRIAAEMWETLRRGDAWTGDNKLRRRHGTAIWVKTTAIPKMGRNGTLDKVITVYTDITDAKLRQQEGPLRAMFDRLQDEVYIFSVDDLRLHYLNKRARASLGWERLNYRSHFLSETTSTFDEARFRERVAPLLAGEVEAVIYESSLSGRPVEINLQLDESVVGEPRFVAVVRDISQRKQVEQARAAFVATVTHELRAPMTSIKGAMKLVASGATGPIPDKPAQMIDLALRNVDRLLLLINDLLDLEKLDNAQTEIRRDPVNLAELIDDAIAHNMGYAQEYGVTFTALPAMPSTLQIVGDRDRLMQVLTNLMSNAAKFSEVGGVVEVGLEDRGDEARITVTDHGIGIPEEAQSRLFERFVQAETAEHKKRKGTGLGLSIVKSIVERHGGRVDFFSIPGEGTTFVIDLPKASDEMSRAA